MHATERPAKKSPGTLHSRTIHMSLNEDEPRVAHIDNL